MPTESSYARKQKEEIARAIRKVANLEVALSVSDTTVTVTTEDGQRTLPVAKGVQVTPGDQVVVIDTGGGAVVICAVAVG